MTDVSHLLRAGDPLRGDERPDLRRQATTRVLVLREANAHATAPFWQARASDEVRMGRRAALVALAATIVGAVVLPTALRQGNARAAVRFEVRLADAASTPDADSAAQTAAGLRLDPTWVVDNDDIAAARVVEVEGTPAVAVHFTEDGAERLRAVTAGAIGRLLAVVVDGRVVVAPRITSAMGRDALVTGRFSRDEAQRIADGIVPR